MKALVTGGAGFVGSHLVDRLLWDGWSVVVLDDFSTGHPRNLRGSEGEVEVVNGSILDQDLVDRLVENVDVVFHLAATVGVKYIVENPLLGILTNVQGTENVLRACWKYLKRVLVTSTSEVYGKAEKVPFREEDDRVFGATSVARWSYATSKAIDEHLAFAYADKGLRVSTVRYFNSYGPRVDRRGYGSVVAQFIRQALNGEPLTVYGDGNQSRCFTYVSDTVEGTYLAGTLDRAVGRVYNIGTTTETTIRELAEAVIRQVGSSSEIVEVPFETVFGEGFEDTLRRVPCIERAKKDLGWEPSVSLCGGLERTITWCRDGWGQ